MTRSIANALVYQLWLQGGGASHRHTLTAYCTIALLEDDPDYIDLLDFLNGTRTIEYLENSYNSVSSRPYSLAIITYALALASSSQTHRFLARLHELSRVEGELCPPDLMSSES